jgi:hypothetical protein
VATGNKTNRRLAWRNDLKLDRRFFKASYSLEQRRSGANRNNSYTPVTMNGKAWQNIAVMVLALIGAVVILGVLAMWLMHPTTPGITAVASGVSDRVLSVALLVIVLCLTFLLVRRTGRKK